MTKILRNDLQIISSLIEENEKVLDVGCGNGNLIEFLSKEKNVDCKGIEIELEKMNFCLQGQFPQIKVIILIQLYY